MDAVIEMLSAYQEDQARRRRRKLTKEAQTNMVEERNGVEEGREKVVYKPLRFPEGPSPGRVRAVLALFQNRRMDDLFHTQTPDSDLTGSRLLDTKLSESDFRRMLKTTGIWPTSDTIMENEGRDEVTNKANKGKPKEFHEAQEIDRASKSDLKVERFF